MKENTDEEKEIPSNERKHTVMKVAPRNTNTNIKE